MYQWFTVGIHLGLSFSALKTIEENHRQVERCRIDMLDMWLKGPEENRSKQILQNALKQLAISVSLPPSECKEYNGIDTVFVLIVQQTKKIKLKSSSSVTSTSLSSTTGVMIVSLLISYY